MPKDTKTPAARAEDQEDVTDTDQQDAEILPEVESEIALATLSGDIRDAMLTRFRLLKRPYSELSQQEQTEVANGLELAANEIVRKAVRELTSWEVEHAVVTLGEVKIKGEKGIEAKITCPNIEHNRTILGEHVGSMVTVVMIDSAAFMGERGPAAIDPDQAELEIEGDYPDGPPSSADGEADDEGSQGAEAA